MPCVKQCRCSHLPGRLTKHMHQTSMPSFRVQCMLQRLTRSKLVTIDHSLDVGCFPVWSERSEPWRGESLLPAAAPWMCPTMQGNGRRLTGTLLSRSRWNNASCGLWVPFSLSLMEGKFTDPILRHFH
ncbi:hypothetical protein E2C01_035053 [Portunus trituberculatus]|uniref:Uncharacterized protein n=1 Tax=Portunus trituberculatus TaxID=210409 RepID=A0A5B7F352_PORTR|nr:hypothetical protein [Portunus trituberculatus]